MGHPHSDRLRLTERYRRRDFGHLSIEMTIDDPGTYAKTLTYTQPAVLLPDTDLLEYFCTENERASRPLKKEERAAAPPAHACRALPCRRPPPARRARS